MKVLIIEDEINAFEYLSGMLQKIDSDIDVIKNIDSVSESLNWLEVHQEQVDLIFMDIQLSDGLSFEIFNHIEITTPIIFTTAYDQYALEAFKVYSVDYLLKPIHKDDLLSAVDRFKKLYQNDDPNNQAQQLREIVNTISKPKKNRCLVKRGGHYEHIDVSDIAYVNSEDSMTFLHSTDGKRHIYSKTVEHLYQELDESKFYQINRSQILNVNSIHEVHPYLNQRLKILVKPELNNTIEFVVSRNRMADFKDWLDQ